MNLSQRILPAVLVLLLVTSGMSGGPWPGPLRAQNETSKPTPPEPKAVETDTPPPEVVVALPIVKDVTDYEDFTGRTRAVSTVEIRGRVTGYLDKVSFKEGTDVKQGDLLFEIDPRPYQAALDLARATLASDQAAVAQAEVAYKRMLALIKANAVSVEDMDRAKGDLEAAKANIARGEANVRVAQINLDFTRIPTPITGRIGRSLVDPGNLVKADDTVLAIVVNLDPMNVYFDVDEKTLLRLRRLVRDGKIKSPQEAEMPAFLGLADEQDYPRQGTVNFVDNQVNPDTGLLRMRAVFSNADGMLTPGMFARLRLPIGSPHKALLVPEKAIGTDQGQKFLYVVNDENKVVYRSVKVGPMHEGLWVIEEGSKPEDHVIINGTKRVRPGLLVKPHLAEPSAPSNPQG